MINSALAEGLTTICFTEHYDPFYPKGIEEEGLFDLDTHSYLKKAAEYKSNLELNSKMQLYFGIELGIYPGIYEECAKIINENSYDFVICSSHTALQKAVYTPTYWENKTVVEGTLDYFEEILTNVRNFKDFDVYGHIDFCLRYVKSTREERDIANYKEILEEIFKTIIEDGKGIEINSGGRRSTTKEFNPCAEYLKFYRELGGEIITFGSDAHRSEHVGYDRKAACELLKSLGFKYHANYKERKPQFIKL